MAFQMEKAKVLLMSANPLDAGSLMLDEEVRSIEGRLVTSEHRDRIQLIPKWATRPQDLLEHLNRHRPHVVHFSGHGTEAQEIVLVGEGGQSQPVGRAVIANLFKVLKDEIRVVLLNACFSQSQAEAITEHIDCAIGMRYAIGDRAAIIFAGAFYSALGFGRSVGQAFNQGVLALALESVPEENTPILLTRRGVDADKLHLFSESTLAPRGQAVELSKSETRTVLIVEDDLSIQALLGSLLRREGFRVLTAATARQALDQLIIDSADLVLLDMELPDGNGLDLARSMRMDEELAIIFLTRRAAPIDKITGLSVGGDDYVTKPFDPEELLARIASVMRRVRTKGAVQ